MKEMSCGSAAGFSADGTGQSLVRSTLPEEASQMSGLLQVKYSKASWQSLVLGTDVEYSFSELMVFMVSDSSLGCNLAGSTDLGSGLYCVTSCLYQFLLFGI